MLLRLLGCFTQYHLAQYEPPKPKAPAASMTCADAKGLIAAHLTEAQMLLAVHGQTIAAGDLECIRTAGLPASVAAELAAHVVGGP